MEPYWQASYLSVYLMYTSKCIYIYIYTYLHIISMLPIIIPKFLIYVKTAKSNKSVIIWLFNNGNSTRNDAFWENHLYMGHFPQILQVSTLWWSNTSTDNHFLTGKTHYIYLWPFSMAMLVIESIPFISHWITLKST